MYYFVCDWQIFIWSNRPKTALQRYLRRSSATVFVMSIRYGCIKIHRTKVAATVKNGVFAPQIFNKRINTTFMQLIDQIKSLWQQFSTKAKQTKWFSLIYDKHTVWRIYVCWIQRLTCTNSCGVNWHGNITGQIYNVFGYLLKVVQLVESHKVIVRMKTKIELCEYFSMINIFMFHIFP